MEKYTPIFVSWNGWEGKESYFEIKNTQNLSWDLYGTYASRNREIVTCAGSFQDSEKSKKQP
jgi:hypothetical protein